jgi:hypothetical protein
VDPGGGGWLAEDIMSGGTCVFFLGGGYFRRTKLGRHGLGVLAEALVSA